MCENQGTNVGIKKQSISKDLKFFFNSGSLPFATQETFLLLTQSPFSEEVSQNFYLTFSKFTLATLDVQPTLSDSSTNFS